MGTNAKRFISLSRSAGAAAMLLLLLPDTATAQTRSAPSAQPGDEAPDGSVTTVEQSAPFGKLPLAFVSNAGQTDERVRFSVRAGGGATFYFTPEEAVFAFEKAGRSGDGEAKGIALRLAFVGANPRTAIEGQGLLPGKVNYFIGDDPSAWLIDLPTYERVVYRDLWPGVDMVFRGDASRLKYEFVVRPGAKIEDIQLAYSGADGLSVDPEGQLLIGTALGTLKDVRPLSYQDVGGKRLPVESRFLLRRDSRAEMAYGFAVGEHDVRQPLVIDPGLLYSTYLGGTNIDIGNPIAVDSAGNAYVTGETTSNNFPTTAGAFDTTFNTQADAFVTKLNPTGTALVYSTYLGGGNNDRGFGIALDPARNAYVTGETNSNNFPTTAGAFDTTHVNPDGFDAFVTKLNAAGSMLAYSTYLGGNAADSARGIAVDAAGSAYVTGQTDSSNFPTTAGAFDMSQNGNTDAFVTKLNAAGSAPLVYSTFLGGAQADMGFAIALDAAGSAYVAGETTSNVFPTTAGAFDTTPNGSSDAFVTKFNAAGSSPLLYSTYLGGANTDRAFGIVVDGVGSAYLAGETSSSDFPTTFGAFDTTSNGGSDAFVTKLNAAGSAPLVYSTFLGGGGNADLGLGIALDSNGSAYVTGSTNSADFPTTAGAFDTSYNTNGDAFVTKLNAAGSAPLAYSTFLGGSAADEGHGIVVDAPNSAYVTGKTVSSNFPTTAGAFDTSFNTQNDAFVTKISTTSSLPAALTLSPAADTNPVGTSHTVTATVTDEGGAPTPGITVRFSVTGSVTTSGSCTTDANGQCSFTYTGPAAPGADVITAYADTDNDNTQDAGEPSGAAAKTWIPGAPATLVLTPPADTNIAGTEHCVTATVRDAGGNPTPGITVRFSVTGANSASGSATTDANGQAVFCYTGNTAGQDAITAFADTDNDGIQDPGEPSGAATKTWTPGAPATVVVTPPAASNTVGTEHCVTATVRDAFGNPVPNVTVRFSVSGANSAAGSATTNANGEAAFCYTGTVAGLDTITAFADTDNDGTQDPGEPSGAATKTWTPGAPATLVLTPPADENEAGEEHCVTATVRDAFGNPTPGILVRFSVTGANPGSGSSLTDADGQATFCYTGTKAGADAIHAFADTDNDNVQDPDEPSGDATKAYRPGPPASLSLEPETATNEAGEEHCVTATVEDRFGNRTPGILVRFSVTGANTFSGSSVTDANGQATFCYVGTRAGTDTISAFADTNANTVQDDGEPGDTASKIYKPGPPASVVLEPATAENEVGFEHCVTATVTDRFGNPTPGIVVRFSVVGVNSLGGSAVTDANGQAKFCYTSTRAGADAIHAYADTDNDDTQDAGEPSGDATKVWKPGPPASLELTPPTATNTAGQQHCVTATVLDRFGNPTPGIVVRFSVSGANTAAGAGVTDANGMATFCYTGTRAGMDTIFAFADTNLDTVQDNGEPGDTASKKYEPGPPAIVTLDPAAAVNVVGERHCVTATVTDRFGNPTPGITVNFSVPTAVATFASPSSGSAVTDANGQATFCFSAALPGEDAIHAYADTDNDDVQDADEPFGDATKTWALPASTAFCEVKITQGGWIVANNGDQSSFGGNAKVPGDATSVQGEEEYQDHGPAQPRNVHSIELLATTCSEDLTAATVFGTATVDGAGMFVFRIDVMDQGEPGTNDSYGIMMNDGYFSGQHLLQGGNVQIHMTP